MKTTTPQIALEKMMELYEDLETLLKGYDDINLDTQLSKAYKDFNDSFEIVQKALEDLELLNAYEKELSLHDSQAVSPSVLRKIDVLDKALEKAIINHLFKGKEMGVIEYMELEEYKKSLLESEKK